MQGVGGAISACRALVHASRRPQVAIASSSTWQARPMAIMMRGLGTDSMATSVFRNLPASMVEKITSRPVESILDREIENTPGYDQLDTGGLFTNKDFSVGDGKIRKWQEDMYKSLKLNHYVAEVKRVVHVNKKGRLSRMSALVCVGNGDGSGGYAVAKADTVMAAIQKAKFKAMINLKAVERYDNRTILYPVDGKYGASRLRMRPVTDGYGIVAHYIIKEVCGLVGISDISVTHLGSQNRLNVVRAAFDGFSQLMSLKDYCLKNRLNAVDFRRVMGRHAMFAPRSPVHARRREYEINYKKEFPGRSPSNYPTL